MLNRPRAGDARGAQPHRIGELLVAAGILNAEKLPEALELAKKTGVPIGRVLVMFGSVKQQDVDSALQVQRLIRESTVSPDFGITALTSAHGEAVGVEEVLRRSKDYIIKNPLGELLVEAGMITRQQLNESIRTATHSNMPLGKFLSLTGMIGTPVLFSGLNAQMSLRDKTISRQEAIDQIKAASLARKALPNALLFSAHGNAHAKADVKLGELLTMAELISETDVLAAIELGLFKNKPVGQVLVEHKLIHESLIRPALQLQKMVQAKELRPTQAAEVLMFVHKRQCTIEQAAKELGLNTTLEGWKEALDLLKTSGLVSDMHYRLSVSAVNLKLHDVRGALSSTGAIDELLFQAAMRCQFLMTEQKMRLEQAVIALHYCARSRTNLDEAIKELSWSV
jgi:hypothetical protein